MYKWNRAKDRFNIYAYLSPIYWEAKLDFAV